MLTRSPWAPHSEPKGAPGRSKGAATPPRDPPRTLQGHPRDPKGAPGGPRGAHYINKLPINRKAATSLVASPMPPTPFLQNVGKLVATIMEHLVSEDNFDDFGVHFEGSEGPKLCRGGPGGSWGGSWAPQRGPRGHLGSPWAVSGGTLGVNGGPQGSSGDPFGI